MELLDPPAGFRSWHGGPTLMGALRGVDHKQAAWKPYPDRHSIWELALHIAYWNYTVTRCFIQEDSAVFGRSPANFPKVDENSEAAWREDKLFISQHHDHLILALRGFPPSRLNEKTQSKKKWSYGQLMAGIMVHNAYHVAQIQLMKRLYRSMLADRPPEPPTKK